MEFTDRRPGAGQLDIFGGEHEEPAAPPQPSPEAQDRQRRLEGARSRRDHSGDRLWDSTWKGDSPTHPTTGLPTKGLIPVERVGMDHYPLDAPSWSTVRGSARSARRANSTVQEVPIQDAHGPTIKAAQSAISAVRLHQQMEHPETTSNPRLPERELPYAYKSSPRDGGEHILVDGHHRVAGALLRNEMFHPMRVMTDANRPAIEAHTARIQAAKARAMEHTGVDPYVVLNAQQWGLTRRRGAP